MRQSPKRQQQQTERETALAKLRALCPPGTTVYNVLRHVSRSGMQRVIDPFVLVADDYRPSNAVRPFYLRGWLRDLGYRIDRTRDGIVIGGCGMDMGFHLVYNLSAAIYADGYGCTGEGCLSNDHANGDRDYTPHSCTGIGVFSQQHDAFHPETRQHQKLCAAMIPPRCCHWHRDGGYALRAEWV